MSKSYYEGGKRGQLDGVPIWRPSWFGELGNDREFIEATKPRTAFKAAYYDGGHRMVVAGIPVRLSAYVKGWRPATKAMLLKGSQTPKEQEEIKAQLAILFA